MRDIKVIKIGGNVIDNEILCTLFLSQFAAIKGKKILIHGGGKIVTQIASQLNIPQQMLNGRRITDAKTLKVATMVYAGLLNKNIVAQLQNLGCDALGLCGADGHIIKAHKRVSEIDFGFVGDIDAVQTDKLEALLEVFDTLVIAPISLDNTGQLLNTNADTIAQEIAKAFASKNSVDLIFTFENAGVLLDVNDENSVISKMNQTYFETLKNEQKIFDGMIPKLENAFRALHCGVSSVFIGSAAHLKDLVLGNSGTKINL